MPGCPIPLKDRQWVTGSLTHRSPALPVLSLPHTRPNPQIASCTATHLGSEYPASSQILCRSSAPKAVTRGEMPGLQRRAWSSTFLAPGLILSAEGSTVNTLSAHQAANSVGGPIGSPHPDPERSVTLLPACPHSTPQPQNETMGHRASVRSLALTSARNGTWDASLYAPKSPSLDLENGFRNT